MRLVLNNHWIYECYKTAATYWFRHWPNSKSSSPIKIWDWWVHRWCECVLLLSSMALETGSYNEQAVTKCLNQLIDASTYVHAVSSIPTQGSKKLRRWKEPFLRTDSTQRPLFHDPGRQKFHPLHPLYNCCLHCKMLYRSIKQSARRTHLRQFK